MKRLVKAMAYGASLFLCNYVVNRIPFHCIRLFYYRKFMRFKIGSGSYVLMGVIFDAPRKFEMGENSTLTRGCKIGNRGGIKIGNNVSVAEETFLLAGDHDPNDPYFSSRFAPVVIEDHAFIGSRAMILKGVCVGRGAIVGAGAVVHKNVASHQIVAGNPAKPVGERNSDLRYTIHYGPWFQ
jgi:maltose O-acetyltransferase